MITQYTNSGTVEWPATQRTTTLWNANTITYDATTTGTGGTVYQYYQPNYYQPAPYATPVPYYPNTPGILPPPTDGIRYVPPYSENALTKEQVEQLSIMYGLLPPKEEKEEILEVVTTKRVIRFED